MRRRLLCLIALLMLATLPARAELLRATRDSVFCTSASALAKLALPQGGSRDIDGHAPPAIARTARDGGCNTLHQGEAMILEQARARTSIVRIDSGSGDGVMVHALVANIDTEPYVPPHGPFYDTVRARCPTLLEGIAAEDPPTYEFVRSLPPPLRSSIDKAVDDACSDLGSCMSRNRAAQIGQHHLEERWATFLCTHPALAAEPLDQSAGPVRD